MRKLPLVQKPCISFHLAALLLATASLTFSSVANASQQPAVFQGRPELEVAAAGLASRKYIRSSARVPARALRAWQQFLASAGGSWRASWDQDTAIPSRIYGSGIPAPGAVASPTLAKQYAHEFLAQHIALLAPGSGVKDFQMVSNQEFRGIRSIGFIQRHAGLPVVGGQISLRFKADRLVMIGSEALPNVSSKGTGRQEDVTLGKEAVAWITQDSASSARSSLVEGPMILPIVSRNSARYYRVMRVTVDGRSPRGRWSVYLDPSSGKPVARTQILRFSEATVRFNAPVRQPLAERRDYPAKRATLTVDGSPQQSDETGGIAWSNTNPATVDIAATGPLVSVSSQTGPTASASRQATHGGTLTWNEANAQLLDAQLSTFIHAGIAKEAARVLSPNLTWLDTQLPVIVNIDDACNAFSDGNSINFYVESSQCANTGRLADVVYHEFGHSLHAHSIIEGVGAFDGAFSEGLSDYFAASITGDHAMAPGFFRNESPLRDIDPSNSENIWPDDIGEIHYTGLIFAGAMWDLRKTLIRTRGSEAGARIANQYFYGAVQRASNIPATYAEVLLEDDDDGNLANGTPNICDINVAFGAHGLRDLTTEASNLGVVAPSSEGYQVKVKVGGLWANCPGDNVRSASITWEQRADPTIGDLVDMSPGVGPSRDTFFGTIPQSENGTVIRYSVRVEFSDGTARTFPQNAADPFYEFYVGNIVNLYCTDFETDPFVQGWTHGLAMGDQEDGADDWQWGPPQGEPGSGDPFASFSGDGAVGNDLGGTQFNGIYQPDKVNFLLSPKIDIGDYSDIRLQYRRWLNVEDGFFDQASIYSNDQRVWSNFNSDDENNSTLHHQDREWRFHDVPLSSTVVESDSGKKVQIKYELSSDGGLELGGWTIDDFCIVARADVLCGDGAQAATEECDDGAGNSDTTPDACRTTCLAATCGDGVLDNGEQCDDGNTLDGDACLSSCLFNVDTGGDCGCVVGDARPWPWKNSILALFAVLGFLLLRGRNTHTHFTATEKTPKNQSSHKR